MKKVLFSVVFVVVSLYSLSSQADGGGSFQFLQGEGDFGKTGTVDYFWSREKFSGYGFYDKFENGPTQYFTEHSLYYSVSKRFFLAGEVTQSEFGDIQKVGAGVNLSDFVSPVLPFSFFQVSYFAKSWGATAEQTTIVWQSKKLTLSENVSVYLSGFANILDHGPNFAQSQLWFAFGSSKFEVGLESERFGRAVNTSLALKYNF